MSKPEFVIIATEGVTTDLLYQRLSTLGKVSAVFIEPHETVRTKLKRRIKKVSFVNLSGQVLFLTFIYPILKIGSKTKIKELVEKSAYKYKLDYDRVKINSVNDPSLVKRIGELNPDFIFINGTRIVRADILEQIKIPVLNLHVGITPTYRGIHGGYWALYNNDVKNFGVTFHYVDAGIDTGKVIAQKILNSGNNNFVTYPILQYLAGLDLVKIYFEEGKSGTIENSEKQKSKLHYHPRFMQYLAARIFRGIK